jgi:hypothetical protein
MGPDTVPVVCLRLERPDCAVQARYGLSRCATVKAESAMSSHAKPMSADVSPTPRVGGEHVHSCSGLMHGAGGDVHGDRRAGHGSATRSPRPRALVAQIRQCLASHIATIANSRETAALH